MNYWVNKLIIPLETVGSWNTVGSWIVSQKYVFTKTGIFLVKFYRFFAASSCLMTIQQQNWNISDDEPLKNMFLEKTINKCFIIESRVFSVTVCILIKQFVGTNCSKERPGSIVNKTLKNGILTLIGTSKESDFYGYFKYISFIKFSVTH